MTRKKKGPSPQDLLLMMREEDEGADAPVMLVYFIDGGAVVTDDKEGLMVRAVQALEQDVRPLIPPGLIDFPEGSAFHITVKHDEGCPCQKTRDERDCTCESLACEAMVVTPFEVAMLETTGMYDKAVELEEGTIREAWDGDDPEGKKLTD
jgi:hypothetical protein